MANPIVEKLEAQVKELTETVDTEREQVNSALQDLKTENDELKAIIAAGGFTPEIEAKLQSVSDNMATAISSVKSFVPDEPNEDE